jgi:Rod binding domain-containing protein
MDAISAIPPTIAPMRDLQAHGDPKAVGEAFDGMFASMLIKQMRESLDEGLFGKDGGDVLGGLFDQFLGEHIAKAGGIGVGDMIRAQLELNNQGTRSS